MWQSVFAAEVPLEEARQLLKAGQADAAFKLLAPHGTEKAGELGFDYLFGISALESNRPDIAVFALERAMADSPRSAFVHADLARAYMALGERDAAFAELEQAKHLNSDARTAMLIKRQLDVLNGEEFNSKGHLTAFLEFALGHDTNINSATSSKGLVIPAFGGFTFSLGGSSVKIKSGFVQESAGVGATYPLGENTAAFARLSGTQRIHSDHQEFDTASLDTIAGIAHVAGPHHFSLSLQNYNYELNGADYRYNYSLNGQWQMQLSPDTQAGLFVQGGRLVYPNASLRNAKRFVGGFYASHILALPKKPLVYASLYAGTEQPEDSGLDYLGHHLQGIRGGGEMMLIDRLSAHIGLGYEKRSYGGNDPLFLVGREDRQKELNLGMVYTLPHGFSLRPTTSYVKNDSNVALNKFDRLETMFNVRKEF